VFKFGGGTRLKSDGEYELPICIVGTQLSGHFATRCLHDPHDLHVRIFPSGPEGFKCLVPRCDEGNPCPRPLPLLLRPPRRLP
jgi:hypothetical protein